MVSDLKFGIAVRNVTTGVKRAVSVLADALLPPHCVLCGLRANRTGNLCAPCRDELPRIVHPCRTCALPGVPPGSVACGACLANRPVWDEAIASLIYEYPVDQLVQAFKFRQNFVCGETLAGELVAAVESSGQTMPEAILPVPLHFLRRFQRGFNQSEFLARQLGKRLHIPVLVDKLQRPRRTRAQSGLDRKARRENIRAAFSCGAISHRRVALVDDVLTTGTTLAECARVLKQAGASEVLVWVAARVPDPRESR